MGQIVKHTLPNKEVVSFFPGMALFTAFKRKYGISLLEFYQKKESTEDIEAMVYVLFQAYVCGCHVTGKEITLTEDQFGSMIELDSFNEIFPKLFPAPTGEKKT